MRRHHPFLSIAAALLLANFQPAHADVRLPAIISEHMVLEQGAEARVWGWAAPDEKVEVKIADQTTSTTADKDGKWSVKLKPIAAGGPYELTVAGKNTITVKDVLAGEVWVCSGQSNMEWAVANSGDAQKEISEANYPLIRIFHVPNGPLPAPGDDTAGRWFVVTPANIPPLTAVGYYFGRGLHKQLNVPVGLLQSGVGGTPAEAWTSWAAMKAVPSLSKAYTEPAQEQINAYDPAKAATKYQDDLMAWQAAMDKRRAAQEAAAATRPADAPVPPQPPAPPKPQRQVDPRGGTNFPASLYNGKIAPLTPYAIRGAIWYQGESNAGAAAVYFDLLSTLIADWRTHWGQGDFPFGIVQLANYMGVQATPAENSGWATVRDAQLQASRKLPNVGLALAIDIGDAADIHPKNKQEVGRRLALWALAKVYNKSVVYSGPIYESMKVEGETIRLKFDHLGGGLMAKGDKLTGFAIAGEDKVFHFAEATIDGDSVVVRAAGVAKPAAVRYAWANNPVCNLFNKEGLPASPFRTDDWAEIAVAK